MARYSTPGNRPSDFYGGSNQQQQQTQPSTSYWGNNGQTPAYQNFGTSNMFGGMGSGAAGMMANDGPSGFMSGMEGTWQEPGYSNNFVWEQRGIQGGNYGMGGLGNIGMSTMPGGAGADPTYASDPNYQSQMMAASDPSGQYGGGASLGIGSNQGGQSEYSAQGSSSGVHGGGPAQYTTVNGQPVRDRRSEFWDNYRAGAIAQYEARQQREQQQQDLIDQHMAGARQRQQAQHQEFLNNNPGWVSPQEAENRRQQQNAQVNASTPLEQLQRQGTSAAQVEIANRGAAGNAVSVGNQQAPQLQQVLQNPQGLFPAKRAQAGSPFDPDPALSVDVDQMGQDILAQMEGGGGWNQVSQSIGGVQQQPGQSYNRGPQSMGGYSFPSTEAANQAMGGFWGGSPQVPGSQIPTGTFEINGVPYTVNTFGQGGYGGGNELTRTGGGELTMAPGAGGGMDTLQSIYIPDSGPELNELLREIGGIPLPGYESGPVVKPVETGWQPQPGANPIIGQQPNPAFGGQQQPQQRPDFSGQPFGGTGGDVRPSQPMQVDPRQPQGIPLPGQQTPDNPELLGAGRYTEGQPQPQLPGGGTSGSQPGGGIPLPLWDPVNKENWEIRNGMAYPKQGGGQQQGSQQPQGSMAIGPDGKPYGGTPNLYPPQQQTNNGPFGFPGGGWGNDVMEVPQGWDPNTGLRMAQGGEQAVRGPMAGTGRTFNEANYRLPDRGLENQISSLQSQYNDIQGNQTFDGREGRLQGLSRQLNDLRNLQRFNRGIVSGPSQQDLANRSLQQRRELVR